MTTNFDFITSPELISGDFFLELHQLDQAYFPTPWSIEAFKNFTASYQFLLVIIKSEQKTLGYSLFDVLDADSFAHLLKILIISELRGQNFGEQLFNESLMYLQNRGIKKFFLEVESSNLAAIKIYKKKGLKKVHLNKNFYGPGRHADIMTLETEL